jgi:DNA-binding LacI/PurR family transcriptional regulator
VGRAATELLIERIAESKTKPVTCKIMPQLSVRESCGFQLRTRTLTVVNNVEA